MGKKAVAVDLKKFKTESGLDEDMVSELYMGFLEELLGEKDKLLAQLSNSEIDKLIRTIHNIKGISGSYMAVKVFGHAAELEARLKQGIREETEVLVNKLADDIIEAAGEIYDFTGCKRS